MTTLNHIQPTNIKYDLKKNSCRIPFVKPKYATSIKLDGYAQIYVNGIAQWFIICSKCHDILAWKSNDGTKVMEKHTNTCKEELASSVAKKSIESYFFSKW